MLYADKYNCGFYTSLRKLGSFFRFSQIFLQLILHFKGIFHIYASKNLEFPWWDLDNYDATFQCLRLFSIEINYRKHGDFFLFIVKHQLCSYSFLTETFYSKRINGAASSVLTQIIVGVSASCKKIFISWNE